MEEKEVLTIAEIYGYVRVSTKEQNEDRQMIAYQHSLALFMRDDFSKSDADEIEKAM